MTGLFWNRSERRIRSLWRLVLQAALAIALIFPAALILYGGVPSLALEILMANIVIIIAVMISAKWIDRRRMGDLGITLEKTWLLECAVGLLLGGAAMTIVFVAFWSMDWVTAGIGTAGNSAMHFWGSLIGFSGLMVLTGYAEELLVRGYQLRNLAEGLRMGWIGPRFSLCVAWVLTSTVFALLHIENPNISMLALINIAGAGFLLGLPVLLTGRLGLSVGLHIAWNLFQGVIYGFPVSGILFPATLFTTHSHGPEVWTGGTFGPEAGLVVTLVVVLCAMAILGWYYWRQGALRLATKLTEYHSPRVVEPPSESVQPDAELAPREDGR